MIKEALIAAMMNKESGNNANDNNLDDGGKRKSRREIRRTERAYKEDRINAQANPLWGIYGGGVMDEEGKTIANPTQEEATKGLIKYLQNNWWWSNIYRPIFQHRAVNYQSQKEKKKQEAPIDYIYNQQNQKFV
jgi:hypothetical protein